MAKILDILHEFLKEVESNNPYRLVLKGGTALSIYYLDKHRESEDLDFDADIKHIKKVKDIENYFKKILDSLQDQNFIRSYSIPKTGFASTNRYHITLILNTHKEYRSKIDLDFVKMPPILIMKGKLLLYPPERIFITKAVTFTSRKEFKDLYDIVHLMPQINILKFQKKENVAQLLESVITTISEGDMQRMFKLSFRNVDLHFKNVSEQNVDAFIKAALRKLQIMANMLRK